MIDMILSFKLNDYTSVHRDGICYGDGKKNVILYIRNVHVLCHSKSNE